MLEAGRDQVHDWGLQLLRVGADLERGRERVGQFGVGQGDQHGVDRAEPELGRELAVQLGAAQPGALLRRHLHRRSDALHLQRRAGVVDVRHDIHQQQPVRLLAS